MQFQNLSKDPKVAQFLEQLNDLSDYYQVELRAQLSFSIAGIVPVLNVKPKVIEKMSIKKTKAKEVK